MKLNIKELLDFFDDTPSKGNASAIVGMIGEDLNAAVYNHFTGNNVEVLNDSVVQGFKGGKNLDRWIFDTKRNILHQAEIKSWSATAIGGRRLKSDAGDEEISRIAKYYWDQQMNSSFTKEKKHPNNVSKVLLKMKLPGNRTDISVVESLLLFWMPITSDRAGLNPMSKITVEHLHSVFDTEFKELTIFSVSLYLRQLYKRGMGEKFIDLDLPHFEDRMSILARLTKE